MDLNYGLEQWLQDHGPIPDGADQSVEHESSWARELAAEIDAECARRGVSGDRGSQAPRADLRVLPQDRVQLKLDGFGD